MDVGCGSARLVDDHSVSSIQAQIAQSNSKKQAAKESMEMLDIMNMIRNTENDD